MKLAGRNQSIQGAARDGQNLGRLVEFDKTSAHRFLRGFSSSHVLGAARLGGDDGSWCSYSSCQQLVTAWACDLQEIAVTLIADILGLMPLEFELAFAVTAGKLVFLVFRDFPLFDDLHL